MSSGSVLQVVILQGGSLVGTEILVPGDYRIGRSDECDLHIDEPTLSRVHARLVFNGTRVGIQDLKSDNGVMINGEKVAAREVKSLDDVALGKVTLKFKVIARKESNPPAPSGDKKELNKTVPLAARPDAAELRAAAGMPPAGPTEVAPNPLAASERALAASSGATLAEGARARIGLSVSDPEITAPGAPPSSEFNATQPSARRGQVAPDLAPPPPAAAPPRPVIGLVPPPAPAASAPTPAPKPSLPKPALVPPPRPPEPPRVQLAPPPPPAVEPETKPAKPLPVPSPAKPAAPGKSSKAPMDRTVPKAARADLLNTTFADPAVELLQPGQLPSLRVRVWWGDQQVVCRTFPHGTTVKAAETEGADLPLYGFGLTKSAVLAKVHSSGWAIHVPQGAEAEIRAQRGWEAMQPSLDKSGVGIVPIQPGTMARITRGPIQVEFFALAPQVKLPRAKARIELSLLIPWVGAFCTAASLVIFMPTNLDTPDFTPKALPALRAALVPPKPKEKPKQEKKEKEKPAEKKEKEPPKQTKTPPKPQPKQAQAPVAIAALAKLTSSPAMSNLLAATNKISGGGRPSGLKMVGLKGIGPVALAGTGPGTGGGFGGGPATGGRELLGSVAAIGLGHALKGTPGGTVQSPPRQTQIHGSMSREEIAKVVNAHYQQIRACYERALLREPGLTGKLQIEWTIDMGGGVSQVKTKSSSLKSDEVVDCINDNVKTWRFPKPTGGEVVVSYPFIFNSAGF